MKKIIAFLILIINITAFENISNSTDELISGGKNNELMKILETKYNIDYQDEKGLTPLMKSIYYSNADLTKILIKKGANLNIKSNKGFTALSIAASQYGLDFLIYLKENGVKIESDSNILFNAIGNEYSSYEIIEYLIKEGFDINSLGNMGRTPLMYSIQHKNYSATWQLLNNGADVKFVNPQGKDVLMLLLEAKEKELVQFVIDKGIDVTRRDSEGNNYLHYAIKSKDFDLVKILCNLGVNPLAKNVDGDTPRDLAEGNKELLELLVNKNFTYKDLLFHALEIGDEALALEIIEKIKEINFYNNKGQSPLLIASKLGYLKLVKEFVKKGAVIDQCFGEDFTSPLIEAAKLNNADVALYLIERGANTTTKDGSGREALDYAIEGNIALVKFLISKSSNINLTDSSGKTLIMKAVETDDLDFTEYLLKNGADIKSINKEGHSALTYAVKNGSYSLFKILLDNGAYINVLDTKGNNLLYYSMRNKFTKITDILVENLPLNHKNYNGDNNFYNALEKHNVSLAMRLVNMGIKIQVPNYSSYDLGFLLEDIFEENNLELIKLLVGNGLNLESYNNDNDDSANNIIDIAIRCESFEIFKYLLSLKIPSHKSVKNQKEWLQSIIQDKKGNYFNYLLNNSSLTANQFVQFFNENNRDYIPNAQNIIESFGDEAIGIVEFFLKKGVKLDKKYLYYAVDYGNIELVKYLIKKGVPLTYLDEDGNSLLFYALIRRNFDIADLLIASGLSINAVNSNKITICDTILDSQLSFDYEIFNYLIKNGFKITKEFEKKYADALFVIYGDKLEKYEYYYKLMKSNKNTNISSYGISYLLNNKYYDTLRFLYNNKESLNHNDSITQGDIVNYLISTNNIDLLKFIYKIEKDIVLDYFRFEEFPSNFEIVEIISTKEMLDFIKSINVNLSFIDKERQESLLHKAVLSNNMFLTNYCLENNYDINMKNINGDTPLELANYDEQIEIFKLLFENTDTKALQKIIYDAADRGNLLILEFLISKGINLKEHEGNESLLMSAIKNDKYEMVKFLIKNNFKVSPKKLSETSLSDKMEEVITNTNAY